MSDSIRSFQFSPIQCNPLDGKSTAERIQNDFLISIFENMAKIK